MPDPTVTEEMRERALNVARGMADAGLSLPAVRQHLDMGDAGPQETMVPAKGRLSVPRHGRNQAATTRACARYARMARGDLQGPPPMIDRATEVVARAKPTNPISSESVPCPEE